MDWWTKLLLRLGGGIYIQEYEKYYFVWPDMKFTWIDDYAHVEVYFHYDQGLIFPPRM